MPVFRHSLLALAALAVTGAWSASVAQTPAQEQSPASPQPAPLSSPPQVEAPSSQAETPTQPAMPRPAPAPSPENRDSIAAGVGDFSTTRVFWTEDQTPVDFLEMAGRHTKARWRMLYRPQPPSPTPDRNKAAFTLGALIGDSFLIWEAGDAQQFRNNIQDIVTYCRMLGLGEKMMPRLMAQAKMSEMDEWKDLRQEIVDGQQELIRLLREQKDDDLALLIGIGGWMRSLEIVSKLVTEAPDVDIRPLCIGSPALLANLREDFAQLSSETRRSEMLRPVIEVLTHLEITWKNSDRDPPTQSMVASTHERLRSVMETVTLK